jgi:hypothetical protein
MQIRSQQWRWSIEWQSARLSLIFAISSADGETLTSSAVSKRTLCPVSAGDGHWEHREGHSSSGLPIFVARKCSESMNCLAKLLRRRLLSRECSWPSSMLSSRKDKKWQTVRSKPGKTGASSPARTSSSLEKRRLLLTSKVSAQNAC